MKGAALKNIFLIAFLFISGSLVWASSGVQLSACGPEYPGLPVPRDVQASRGKKLKLASVLQSRMVVQQNKPFKVWGQAAAGQEVRVFADWVKTSVAVNADNDGTFIAMINVPPVKRGDLSSHTLRVYSADDTVVLDSLLIGEVWLCSGQSNMQFAMKEVVNAEAEIAGASFPAIRLLNVALNFSAEPVDEIGGKWTECTPASVRNFSAVAYYFGQRLFKTLDVPVGIIFSGIGASTVQAFVPQEVLEKDSLLNAVYLDPYLKSPKSKEKIDPGFTFEKVTRPFLLYNAMIHPFLNFPIRGFCWYQGETNYKERESFTRATQSLIKSWRKNFGQGELPFYYVQIAPFDHDMKDPALAFDAFFREAQEKVSDVNNTAMVVTMDVGDAKSLHPENKKPVGERLAFTALNRTYYYSRIDYKGPHYMNYAIRGNKVTISFCPETVHRGLRTSNGIQPFCFQVAGKDRKFYPAKAIINHDRVIVGSGRVKHPVAVRYAFTNVAVTNLENGSGLPAVPFRTDNWEE